MTTKSPVEADKSRPQSIHHLSQLDLARRWAISPRTLERWRWTGEGPRYVKLVGRIVYRLEDIEAFENARMHDSTSQPVSDDGASLTHEVRR
jgi:hypothetical protein